MKFKSCFSREHGKIDGYLADLWSVWCNLTTQTIRNGQNFMKMIENCG